MKSTRKETKQEFTDLAMRIAVMNCKWDLACMFLIRRHKKEYERLLKEAARLIAENAKGVINDLYK